MNTTTQIKKIKQQYIQATKTYRLPTHGNVSYVKNELFKIMVSLSAFKELKLQTKQATKELVFALRKILLQPLYLASAKNIITFPSDNKYNIINPKVWAQSFESKAAKGKQVKMAIAKALATKVSLIA